MRAWTFSAIIFLILPLTLDAQSASTDSQTLQALLSEVHQLRQELRIASVTAQRAQILVYRVQAQQAVVTRLSERVENDRSSLSRIQSEQRRLTAAIKHLEDLRATQNDTERKRTEEQLAQTKIRLDQLGNDEQESQPRKIELEEELRVEQAKLTQLHEELDRIDKSLEQLTRAPTTDPQ
jgi:chromosome segregation ATPase